MSMIESYHKVTCLVASTLHDFIDVGNQTVYITFLFLSATWKTISRLKECKQMKTGYIA